MFYYLVKARIARSATKKRSINMQCGEIIGNEDKRKMLEESHNSMRRASKGRDSGKKLGQDTYRQLY